MNDKKEEHDVGKQESVEVQTKDGTTKHDDVTTILDAKEPSAWEDFGEIRATRRTRKVIDEKESRNEETQNTYLRPNCIIRGGKVKSNHENRLLTTTDKLINYTRTINSDTSHGNESKDAQNELAHHEPEKLEAKFPEQIHARRRHNKARLQLQDKQNILSSIPDQSAIYQNAQMQDSTDETEVSECSDIGAKEPHIPIRTHNQRFLVGKERKGGINTFSTTDRLTSPQGMVKESFSNNPGNVTSADYSTSEQPRALSPVSKPLERDKAVVD